MRLSTVVTDIKNRFLILREKLFNLYKVRGSQMWSKVGFWILATVSARPHHMFWATSWLIASKT